MNQIVCQETDNRFCPDGDYFLLYYYVPVTLLVVVLCQIKNYKQVSYMAKIAMIATFIAFIAIIFDSIL